MRWQSHARSDATVIHWRRSGMRLFFAVELPPEVQAALGRLRGAEGGEYRWVEPALLHVTLAFLGEQPDERLAALQAVGASGGERVAAGVLGSARRAASARAGRRACCGSASAATSTALLALQARLARGLRAGRLRRAKTDRPFRPHITLARRRARRAPAPPPDWPPPDAAPTAPTFALQRLTLFESRLSPRGATYTPARTLPLGASRTG